MPLRAVRDAYRPRTPLAHRPWRPAPAFAGGLLACALGLAVAGPAAAQTPPPAAVTAPPPPAFPAPAPPAGGAATDVPNDGGKSLAVAWTASPSEKGEPGSVIQYRLERAIRPDGPFAAIDSVAAGTTSKNDETVEAGKTYWYRIDAAGPGGHAESAIFGPAQPVAQWFNSTRTSVFLVTLLFFGMVLGFIVFAQKGGSLFVRRIPGIDAIEEAIGRATEMGRSVLYVPGINDIDDIQTMASLTILESVAKMTAKYETPIVVPTTYPVVFTLAQEMVKNGFVAAGRPDAYDSNAVRYVTSEQFAYVAAVNGIMLRDKPAANIYMGSFFAESLLLAETGFATKAIQVAGTAQVAQLPFFVVACDYTLIGEEMYAASAYLSREARLLGSLKGSDLLKLVLIVIILVGCVLETAHITGLTTFMSTQ
jgi:hypothetical protein